MKKLLVYINPQSKFVGESETLTKIQVESSLGCGFKIKDILLVTNFEYEYKGVKSNVIPGVGYYTPHFQASKFTTIVELFKNDFFGEGIYWAPDLDAYQQEKISEKELGLQKLDFGVTTYGWSNRWCMGSFFFKKTSKDIFLLIKDTMDKLNTEDEHATRVVLRQNGNDIRTRSKVLNITYNFGMRHVDINYKQAHKPIKVVHFHPFYKGSVKTLDVFMYGKNELGFPLMNKRLIRIFKDHGIE